MSGTIQIATRKSPLARKQTELVREWLKQYQPNLTTCALPISTKVDERLSWSLEKRGGIGLFTKELEAALLDKSADLAVHSAKDMPTAFSQSLSIAGYLPRIQANDLLVRRKNCLKPKTIASGSPRRRAQINVLYPDCEFLNIRGNVATRLEKIASGEADATLLAAAGLQRLGIEQHENLEFSQLPIEQSVPAPGQAAIAIQCRSEDVESYQNCFCPETKLAVSLERAFLRRLGSGCQIPVGAHLSENIFHTFHPETGYRAFPLELNCFDKIEPALDEILALLKL